MDGNEEKKVKEGRKEQAVVRAVCSMAIMPRMADAERLRWGIQNVGKNSKSEA